MLGTWGVGKTSLVRQFVHSVFEEKYLSTLGVKVDKKSVSVKGQDVNLMLWDIAGAEDNFSVPMHYVKGAAGYIMVIDGTRRESLEAALDLVELIDSKVGNLPFIVAVNKSDLQWQLKETEIDSAFKKYNHSWFATSAKTGESVEDVFIAMAEKLI